MCARAYEGATVCNYYGVGEGGGNGALPSAFAGHGRGRGRGGRGKPRGRGFAMLADSTPHSAHATEHAPYEYDY